MKHRTKSEVLTCFKAYCSSIKETPKLPIYRKIKGVPSNNSIRHHFGSWKNLIHECGYRSTRKEYSKQELIDELSCEACNLGKSSESV